MTFFRNKDKEFVPPPVATISKRDEIVKKLLEGLEYQETKCQQWCELTAGSALSVGLFDVKEDDVEMLMQKACWMRASFNAAKKHVETVVDLHFPDWAGLREFDVNSMEVHFPEKWTGMYREIRRMGREDILMARMKGWHWSAVS